MPMSLSAYSSSRPPSQIEPDIVCLSHLRWNFVFQRPQHLMTRYARTRRVYYVEEPIHDAADPRLDIDIDHGVHVVVPHLPAGFTPERARQAQRAMLDGLLTTERVSQYVLWYYTPLALDIAPRLRPVAVVYDCMDELSAFKGASAELPAMERVLMQQADVVFTGGYSLYEAKKKQHRNIHPLPSSVDIAHFGWARSGLEDPADQRALARPRLGFFGVLDERLDLNLVGAIADSRPAWELVMVGPVVKIDPATLPQRDNIHYLGSKSYDDLPAYIAGWDVALLPFARNDATRFISPTKTPEYLAAGKPVVSTSIRDVVTPYGDLQLVRIADNPLAFVRACEHAMAEDAGTRVARADRFLATMSWDITWARSRELLKDALHRPLHLARPAPSVVVEHHAPAGDL